jgi:hypothetical protein
MHDNQLIATTAAPLAGRFENVEYRAGGRRIFAAEFKAEAERVRKDCGEFADFEDDSFDAGLTGPFTDDGHHFLS